MDHIIVRTQHHGTVEVTSAAYDAAMAKYLPSSPMKLRNICEEATGIFYDDVTEVSVFIAVLADWLYNVDGNTLSISEMFRNSYEMPMGEA